MRSLPRIVLGVTLGAAAATGTCVAGDLRDLYFGEALYHAYQGQYFDALARLDAELAQHGRVDEPALDSLQYYIKQADFSVGDFELDYRMHNRAGHAIRAVLDAAVDDSVRNDAAFRLARMEFQADQPEEALHALQRIHGTVPPGIRGDLAFLRANVYMAVGHPAEAVEVLTRLQGTEGLKGFAAYNLGIALLQQGREADAQRQLDKAGAIRAQDIATQAIRDRANMVLGRMFLRASNFGRAQQTFDRVRLEGPYSNQALLSAGWAYASTKNYERAVVPWGILARRDSTDSAVQEARLALPYAYAQLHVYGRAALLYGQALSSFGQELAKVDASIKSVREGKFLKALVREEIEQDRNWVVRLRALPGAPETFYLTDLMASNEFQTALQNYLDLDDLRKRLMSWQASFDAFEDLIRLRRANYEPLLPKIDAKFRELDSQVRLREEQRDRLDRQLHAILIAPRPELLATADERIALTRIRALDRGLKSRNDAAAEALRRRLDRLRGVLAWRLQTEYPERLTRAHQDLQGLNQNVELLRARYAEFVRARQAAVHSYQGFDEPIGVLRSRVADALQQVSTLIARQGDLIETVAIDELESREKRLEAYQTQARYAVADSYDRAMRKQAAGDRQ